MFIFSLIYFFFCFFVLFFSNNISFFFKLITFFVILSICYFQVHVKFFTLEEMFIMGFSLIYFCYFSFFVWPFCFCNLLCTLWDCCLLPTTHHIARYTIYLCSKLITVRGVFIVFFSFLFLNLFFLIFHSCN